MTKNFGIFIETQALAGLSGQKGLKRQSGGELQLHDGNIFAAKGVRPFAACKCAATNVCNAKSPRAINPAQELTREIAKPRNMLKALHQYAKTS